MKAMLIKWVLAKLVDMVLKNLPGWFDNLIKWLRKLTEKSSNTLDDSAVDKLAENKDILINSIYNNKDVIIAAIKKKI